MAMYIDPPSSSKLIDGKVQIQYKPIPSGIGIGIDNKSEDTVKISWNESSIVEDGFADQVMHEGKRLSDRTQGSIDSVVPSKSRFTDIAVAAKNMKYLETAGILDHGTLPLKRRL